MRSFRRDVQWTIAVQAGALGLTVGFLLLSSRWLGAEGRGTQALLTSGGQIAAALLTLGVPVALPAIIAPEPARARAVVRVLLYMGLTVSALLAGLAGLSIAFGLYAPLSGFEIAIAAFIVCTICNTASAGLALALQEIATFNLTGFGGAACMFAALLALRAVHRVSPESALWAQTVGLGIGALLGAARLRRHPALQPAEARSVPWLKFARVSLLGFVSSLLIMLMLRGDTFLTNSLAGRQASGIYATANLAAELLLRIPNWTSQLLGPSVAASGREGAERTMRLFWAAIVFCILGGLVVLLALPILEYASIRFLGSDYRALPLVLCALLPRVIMQGGGTILGGNLVGKGYTRYYPISCGASLVAIFAADFILVPRYGAVGAGLASSIGFAPSLAILWLGFARTNQVTWAEFRQSSVKAWHDAAKVVRATLPLRRPG